MHMRSVAPLFSVAQYTHWRLPELQLKGAQDAIAIPVLTSQRMLLHQRLLVHRGIAHLQDEGAQPRLIAAGPTRQCITKKASSGSSNSKELLRECRGTNAI